MPELPEVETVCRGLTPVLVSKVLDQVLVRRPNLRWPMPVEALQACAGARILSLSRRAKYIMMALDNGQTMLMHLGMSGRMTIEANLEKPFEKHDHVILQTRNDIQVRFNDARRFGMVDLIPTDQLQEHKLVKSLGVEPLGNSFNGPFLHQQLQSRKTNLKAAIMDQKVVVGVGNIYACESLFRANLSPTLVAAKLSKPKAERLAEAIRSVLGDAIAAGGSSLNDYVQTDGELGYFQHQWQVYGREGEKCQECSEQIRRLVQSNRSTFYCANCQG